jgi:hypothetical protein
MPNKGVVSSTKGDVWKDTKPITIDPSVVKNGSMHQQFPVDSASSLLLRTN